MGQYTHFKGSKNPLNAFDVWEYNRQFRKAHPEYFDPDGILMFCGAQGQGKTISAVSYTLQLLKVYPQVVVCSNIALNDTEEFVFCSAPDIETGRVQQWLGARETGKIPILYIPYVDVSQFSDLNNGYAGLLYLIDEMHLEFNSLESKQLDSNIFFFVSQQRKNRKHIVGTAQVFTRLAKPFREQFKWVVMCKCFFKCLQINRLVDGSTATEIDGKLFADAIKTFVWFHRSALYAAYDTLQVIKRTRKDWR